MEPRGRWSSRGYRGTVRLRVQPSKDELERVTVYTILNEKIYRRRRKKAREVKETRVVKRKNEVYLTTIKFT